MNGRTGPLSHVPVVLEQDDVGAERRAGMPGM
jgi:hypothetical protein